MTAAADGLVIVDKPAGLTSHDVVARARAADEALAQAREGAQPAGDPDPYRIPAEAAEADGPEAAPGSGTGSGQ